MKKYMNMKARLLETSYESEVVKAYEICDAQTETLVIHSLFM